MGHNPTEHIQEHVTHEAAHGGGHGHDAGSANKWITAAALTAAFLAALAAVSGMMATQNLTESTQKRIEANDKWNFFGQKSIKGSNIDTRNFEYAITKHLTSLISPTAKLADDIEALHKNDLAKKIEYNDKNVDDSMPSIKAQAEGFEEMSRRYLHTHETFEYSATMFHISIAIVAIAVVAKRKEFWYMSLVGGTVGLYFFCTAIAHKPTEAHEPHPTSEHTAPSAPGHAPAPTGDHKPAPAAEHNSTPEEHAPSTPKIDTH